MPRLTARERREGYLREHGYQKATGKPFFPLRDLPRHDRSAVLHRADPRSDAGLVLGGERRRTPRARKASSARSTRRRRTRRPRSTSPRPDWYFFFLFQLLRIFDKPELLLLATIIIPTIWMVLLISMPFIDRGRERRLSRRPIAIGFAARRWQSCCWC